MKLYNDTSQQAQNDTTFQPSPLLDPLQLSKKGARPRDIHEDTTARAIEHQIAIRFAIANILLIATRSSIAIILHGRNLIANSSHGSTTIDVRTLIANTPAGELRTESGSLRGQSLQQLPQGSFERGAPPRLCQPFLPFRPRFPFAVQVQGSERLWFFSLRLSPFATGRRDTAADSWFASRKTVNRRLHALRGNHWCRLCNCSLVDRTYSYCPEVFRTIPVCLKNGMAVHKEHFCSAHLSLWYYRRGTRHYAVYYGSKARNLYQHLCAARAASGTPGGHGQPKHVLRNFLGLHNGVNRRTIFEASGHESRCASEGTSRKTHQCLRSTRAMLSRQSRYQADRSESRRQYRKWIQDALEDGKFTLVHPRHPPKRVMNSPEQIQRAYGRTRAPTVGSRAHLFKSYVQPSLLDLPPRLLTWRPERNQLHVVTFNIETLVGHGKQEALADFVRKRAIDILAVQETKSTSSDERRVAGGKLLLSGTPSEHMAGVGFFIPARSLPLVADFLPYSGRIASLTLRTQPLPTHLITLYAPSQLVDPAADEARKDHFWDELQTFHNNLSRPSLIVYMGDLNARIIPTDLEEFSTHIGKAVFPSDPPADDTYTTNYFKMLDFMVHNDFLVASSFHKRPDSRILTYREIASSPEASLTQPSNSDFACLDHVLLPMTSLHNLKAASTQPTWTLPWFHRHYPLSFTITFDKFVKPPKKPPPKITPPRTKADQLKFQRKFADTFATLTGSTSYTLGSHPNPLAASVFTDGSCPDQYHVSVGNPAGWGFTIQLPTHWIDAWGPVGQNISTPIPGTNNTAELQALLEALDYISRHKQSHGIKSINLYTDSQLAYDFLHGLSIPKQHLYLLTQIGRLIDHLLPQIQISLMKIKGHAGQQGNERADLLAKKGTTTASNIGRHSPPSRAPLGETLLFRAPRTFELLPLEEQASILQQAALQAAPRTKAENVYKKEYLSEPTKRLIDRIASTPPDDHELLQKLRKAVKRRARKDKRQHLCNNLLQDSKGPPSKQWSTLKYLRKDYVPRTQGIRKPNGQMSSKANKPEVMAEHLKENVWKYRDLPPLCATPIFPPAPIDTSPFKEQELMSALSRLRNRKSPGPDQLPAEIWKYAPREVHKALLAHFNKAFRNAESPRSWKVADIVMIFKGKKKDPTLPASYRPISLINSVYKIYACLLHARLKAAIDDRISPVQFGFRAGRSTSTPLFVLRRLLELHERHQESFFALFLDWSQAFDSVSHNALCNALSRFGIPPQFAEPILSIYHDCHFKVKDAGHLSRSKHFAQGIRQGCPLSPYLFVITLSVLFHDTYEAYQHTYGPRPSVLTTDYRLTDIEYADDTVLLSRTRLSLHRFLHTLQAHSLKRGMSLNQEKCQLLAINSDLPIYLIDFPSHPCQCDFCLAKPNPFLPKELRIEPTPHADYLGSVLMYNSSATADTKKRYGQAAHAAKCLHDFFRHPAISIPRKLLVHSQIVLTILLYGAESQMYLQSHLTKLNKLHYKVLRQIFNLKSSFYHKVLEPSQAECSNEYLSQLAYEYAPKLLSPSQRIISSRIAYLGHILRHADSLEHISTFQTAHAYRRLHRKRPGHPRIHWAELTMTQAYQRHQIISSGTQIPRPYQIHHDIYHHPTEREVATLHSRYFGNTDLWRTLQPLAQNRRAWAELEVLR